MLQTLFDVWEGSLDIDEATIRAGGIVGLIIRLNHISGGHHIDSYFTTQWLQAEGFLRAPYFVYNPWVDGHANYNWLISNLPKKGVSRVFIDIEVVYKDYSPEVYADQVQAFIDEFTRAYPLTVIYTGQWFLPVLAHWPRNVEYWWARYPEAFHPDPSEVWSYEKLEVETEKYGYYPDPQHKCPGPLKLWQCSGDRLKLPGCQGRAVDVNLFNGTLQQLQDWWGAEMTLPPTLTCEQKMELIWNYGKSQGWPLP